MPRAKRCTFRERGRRCPRDGHGEPALCNACRVVVLAASVPKSPTQTIIDALANLMVGRPVDADGALGALQQIMGQRGGAGIQDVFRQFADVGRVPAQAPLPRRPPPGPDPRVAERAAEIAAARRVLGFTKGEVLLEQQIRDRRRELAKKLHPDRAGGDARKAAALTAKMAAVNSAADILLAPAP